VAKGRGAGFLAHPKELQMYLEQVYDKIGIAMSIKTRIGMEDAGEFQQLLEIFNQFPVSELMVHPRVQKDFYKNKPDWEAFSYACQESRCNVVYNGNLFYERGTSQNFKNIFLPAIRS